MKLKGIFSSAIAIAFGLIVLLGYFFNITLLKNLSAVLLNWAVILAGLATFIGVVNLLAVHTGKLRAKEKGWPYSLLLVVVMVITLVAGLRLGYKHPAMMLVFNSIQKPVEASLMAVLAITLAYASIRLLQRRLTLLSVVFLSTALLVLLSTAAIPFISYIPGLSDYFRPFIAQVFAAGGARGILIGVALGTLTTGLRVLFGADRPYGGK